MKTLLPLMVLSSLLTPALGISQGLPSHSLGSVSDGRLVQGVALPLAGRGFRFNPRRDPQSRFATREVIAALLEAAATVAKTAPAAEIWINDLSRAAGGALPHHGSHQNGRDVDVLFCLQNERGEPLQPVGAPLDRHGDGWDFGDLVHPDDDRRVRLDARCTWRFIAALLMQQHATLQRVFIAEHLRQLLLEEAVRQGSSPALVARFAELTCQPAQPHDDHMHLRFFCVAKDIQAGCLELPPVYPWHKQALQRQGVAPRLASGFKPPPSARAKTTSIAEAQRRAGPMHVKVRAWLAKRRTWTNQPHPGRPYCR